MRETTALVTMDLHGLRRIGDMGLSLNDAKGKGAAE